MASNTVRVNVVGDASKLQQAFGQGATAGEKFKARLELIGKAAVAALAVKALSAVKDFVGDSVRAFSDLNESLNALDVTYGAHADGIKKLGEESARNLGISNAEFNTFAVSIANFAKEIAGDSGDVVGVVDEMTTRITDFASVMNLDVAEAQEKFQSGLAGQSRPLREFGIDVSAATVEAYALANGITDGTEAMTESEKIQARYGTIMEQTANVQGDFANTSDQLANKERIVNAELENSKALLGEILSPLKLASLEMQGGLIKSVGDAAIALGTLTGELEHGQAALLEFKNETGRSAETVGDVIEGVELKWQSWTAEIDVWADRLFNAGRHLHDLTEGVRALIDEGQLGTDEMADLREEIALLGRQGKLTEEEIEALTKAIEDEMVAHVNAERDAGRHRGAQRELESQVEDTTDAIKTQSDTLRAQTDPLFAAMKHAQDLEAAQRELNDAIVQYGEDSDEAMNASRDVASAHTDLIGVLEELRESGIDPTGEAARGMLEGMGIPPGTISALFAEFDRIERNFESRVFKLTVSAPSIEYQQRANKITPRSQPMSLHSGGIVPEGLLDGNNSNRREAVVPLDTNEGKQALASAIASAMNGNGRGSAPVYITVNALDPQAAANAVVQALQTYQRGNGAIPIQTR